MRARAALMVGVFTVALPLHSPAALERGESLPAVSVAVVDAGGDVGRFSSLVLDNMDRPVISYVDVAGHTLKLASCRDLGCMAQVSIVTVGADTVGGYTSIDLDEHQRPLVSYWRGDLDLEFGEGRLLRCAQRACSSWRDHVVTSSSFTGLGTSLGRDSSGLPLVSLVDIDDGLHVVSCSNPLCSGPKSDVVVDSFAYAVPTSLVLDRAGLPVIAYAGSGSTVHVARCLDPACVTADVEAPASMGLFGWQGGTSLALDADGNPVVSFFYWDGASSELRLLHCGDPSCSGGNEITTLDREASPSLNSSLKLDEEGNPVVGYGTASQARVLHCGDPACASAVVIATVDSSPALESSLMLDSLGRPVMSYHADGELRLLRCRDPYCGAAPG